MSMSRVRGPQRTVRTRAADALGRLAAVEHGRWRAARCCEQHGVQVIGLVGPPTGAGLEDRGDGHGDDPVAGRQGIDAGLQVRQPVAEVAAEREDTDPRGRRRHRPPGPGPLASVSRGSAGWSRYVSNGHADRGLWLVHRDLCLATLASARHAVASRWASVSMSATGCPEMSGQPVRPARRSRRCGTGRRLPLPRWCRPEHGVGDELLALRAFGSKHAVVSVAAQPAQAIRSMDIRPAFLSPARRRPGRRRRCRGPRAPGRTRRRRRRLARSARPSRRRRRERPRRPVAGGRAAVPMKPLRDAPTSTGKARRVRQARRARAAGPAASSCASGAWRSPAPGRRRAAPGRLPRPSPHRTRCRQLAAALP